MSTKPPPIPEQIIISRFFKTRRRDIVVATTMSNHEGVNIINVRECFIGADGIMRPTTRGIAMSVRKLPELSRALRHALEKAREMNLIAEGEGGE